MKRSKLLLVLLALVPALLACGGTGTSSDETPLSVTVPLVLEATLTHGLTQEMQPVEAGSDFSPVETIHFSAKLKGQPESGVLSADFYWRDSLLAQAAMDLSQEDNPSRIVVGEDTYLGFYMSHEQPLPISERYQVVLTYDGQILGVYPFRVFPPAEAIPSNVREVTLALGVDEVYTPQEATSIFGPQETIYLVARGDMGLLTWIQAEWYVSGQIEEAGTRVFTVDENVSNTGFYFSYVPEEGWPPGDHLVVLTMNDQILGRYPFSIISVSEAAPLAEPDFWQVFPTPNDAEVSSAAEGVDLAFSTGLTEQQLMDFYGAWLRLQGWQKLAPVEGEELAYPYQLWRKESFDFLIEIHGQDEAGRTVVWLVLQPAQ